MSAGDSYVSPGGVPHEVLTWSDDHEVLENTLPANFVTTETPTS